METKKLSQKQIQELAEQTAKLNIKQLNILSNMALEKALNKSNREIIFPLKVLITVTRK